MEMPHHAGKLPKWEDEDSVRQLVDSVLREWEASRALARLWQEPLCKSLDEALKPIDDVRHEEAERILELARRGDWIPLAKRLLEAAESPSVQFFFGPKGEEQQREAYRLISARLRGSKKETPGRVAGSSTYKSQANPNTRKADKESEDIAEILRAHYPKVRQGAITQRAREFAAERAGIEVQQLENYRKNKARLGR